jgi:ATP-dependent helicase/nuclease subunit A
VRAPSLAAADAVQLLTVHGAKGLEAKLVLMLDCDAQAQRAQTMGVLVDWPGAAPAPSRFVFIAREKQPPACAADALAYEQAARQREEINGLYVATTRARGELVLSAVEAARANGQSWWSRLAPHAEAIELPAPRGGMRAAPEHAAFYMKEMPALPVAPAQNAIKTLATAVDERASAFGQAMHRLLEWALPGVPVPTGQGRAVAREFALAFDDARGAAALAERIRAGQGAWAWQADAIDWQGNEIAITHGGQLLRIDRLVRHRESGTWWVLDYKSAARPQHDAALIAQLQRYREAVQAANPDAAVRAAFLTGQGALVEVPE